MADSLNVPSDFTKPKPKSMIYHKYMFPTLIWLTNQYQNSLLCLFYEDQNDVLSDKT